MGILIIPSQSLCKSLMPLLRKEKVTVISIAVALAVVWEGPAVEFGWRIRNVFRKIGCVLDRMCNTVWIITREESLSSDRELSYLWSPVSIKVYPWIKQCLWIKDWFEPNYSLYKESLERVRDKSLPGQELTSSCTMGHVRESLELLPECMLVELKMCDWFPGYWWGFVVLDLYSNQWTRLLIPEQASEALFSLAKIMSIYRRNLVHSDYWPK